MGMLPGVRLAGFCWMVTVAVGGRQYDEPRVILTTYNFGQNLTDTTWDNIVEDEMYPLDAMTRSITEHCELQKCAGSVGPYGGWDETGDLSLDAMLMDGTTYDVGSVAGMRHVKPAISVANAVLKYTKHTLLTGVSATSFAKDMGFTVEDIRTETTNESHAEWVEEDCQPNKRQNVVPDPEENCGPYSPAGKVNTRKRTRRHQPKGNDEPADDTVGHVVIDADGGAYAACSTNGATHKVPGRSGDSPLVGSGGYAVSGVGACAATGDGDIMLRFLPCFQAIEGLRRGLNPREAAQEAIARILQHFPDTNAGVIVANAAGEHSAGCSPADWGFSYAVRTPGMEAADMVDVKHLCIGGEPDP